MPVHRTVAFGEVHVAHSLEYANAAARTGAVGLLATDIGRIARQLDNATFWVLQNHSPLTWSELTASGTGFVPDSRQVIAGTGMTGGGDLSADRTFNVNGNADGSIIANANDVQVGVLATDAQHGTRGGGTQHATAVAGSPGTPGFISGTSQQKLDNLLEVLDENVSLGVGKTKVNFLGSGVSATDAGGGQINVTIPGAGTATITVLDEGVALTPDKNKLNVVGPGIAATTDGGDPSQANVTVSTAAPVAVGDTNTEGAANSLARSNHVHRAEYPAHIFGTGSIAATTTTRYLTPGYDSAAAPTTPVQYRVPTAGTLRRLRVRVNTPGGNGNNVVYTVRLNGVATALTCTVASTANDGSDLVNTVAVAAGDLIDVEVTKAASIGAAIADVVASLEVFV